MLSRPYYLMKIDALGALVSAVIHGVVLVRFREEIGLSPVLLYFLAAIATGFICHSGLSLFLPKPKASLIRIAIGNLIFCLVSTYILVGQFSYLTAIGKTYLIGEILVILILVRIELKVAGRIGAS